MNQKLEAELNLSLSLSDQERMQNPILRSGYDPKTKNWKLILLYNGSLENVQAVIPFEAVYLLGNYAIITIRSDLITKLLTFPEILYLELPRPLYLDAITGLEASCFSGRPFFPSEEFHLTDGFASGSFSPDELTGAGTGIAILDSGVDFRHPDFCTDPDHSRILCYWDQTLPYDGSNPYGFGFIFSNDDLNNLLRGTVSSPAPSADFSGHGTHIAGICAGNGRNSGGKNHGAAPEASLLVVKLKQDVSSVYTDYANLMMAIDFSVKFASSIALPLTINISYGSNDGSHDGNSLMERFISSCIFYGKNTVVIATGNEGLTRRHSQVFVPSNQEITIPFSVAPGETALYLQLWKYYSDSFSYTLFLPGLRSHINIPGISGISNYTLGGNQIRLIISEPTPYQPLQELFLSIAPSSGNNTLSSGIWQLSITSTSSVNGRANLWLPSREATNSATGFLNPSTELTLTIPSTAENVISVSGYDSTTDVFAPFSGSGFSNSRNTKPDLTAPAVNILSTAPGGGYSIRSGTSMAAPFVTGASSLLMQYGIVLEKDPFLYGEKIKALLWKGARPLPTFTEYPNESVGWGALCYLDSITSLIL
ncbi:MAG: S8 family serine peptidase [Eubacterium sp.]|nr:S8 family serine peptidase [Eubacterium sp.]